MPPPPVAGPSRPRSVAARTHSTSTSTSTTSRSTAPTPIPDVPALPANIRGRPGDAETNIQVVLRCRRRSEREVADNSPIVVSSAGAKSDALTIETAAPISSLGVVSLPPTRTYPFDIVFGPEADQAMVFNDVVQPMLDEVLQGYNCTLFAYGQTGTGKTHTMQGDLGTTPLGNPTAQAGMIPRALFRLFSALDASKSDYSVKVSYVELYNEELRDLLAPDLPPPTETAQPMSKGAAASNSSTPAPVELKIFDDAAKRGVVIQGLEEVPVRSAADARALLVRGSQRRQIAATKFNDHSSRSHSIFGITVHTKESGPAGDDLLRVGKLNLVDLAGSENIGRSGAADKRAREAGMINQSLLTLGRVINALVERASHVPYRESKLTRLLQDSLGGRTKTCIVATVSPARCCAEETLSTLDYALRAKSIRNKPELNARLARNALLREYVGEIERLKADLLAAREKNGIFFAEETWATMSVEHERAKAEAAEARAFVAGLESQLKATREEFEESMALLTRRDGELKETKEKLETTTGTLMVKEKELGKTKDKLEEEIVVRRAYQENEAVLDEVARGLKKTVHESVAEVDALHAKLARKTAVFGSNATTVLSNSRNITTHSSKLTADLDLHTKSLSSALLGLRNATEAHQASALESLEAAGGRLGEQLARMQDALGTIQARDDASGEAVADAQRAVRDAVEGARAGFAAWSEKFKLSSSAMYTEIEKASLTGYTTMDKAIKAMSLLVETVVREAQDHVAAERAALLDAKSLSDATSSREITRLREQNTALLRLVETQKREGVKARDELVKSIEAQIKGAYADGERRLQERVADLTEGNDKAVEALGAFGVDMGTKVDAGVARGSEWAGALEKKSGENKRLRDGSLKSCASVNNTLRSHFEDVQSSTTKAIASYSSEVHKQGQLLTSSTSDAFERHSRAKKARLDATSAMATDVQSGMRTQQRAIGGMQRSIEAHAGKVVGETSKLSEAHRSFHSSAHERLASVSASASTLQADGAREDLPTGRTPQRHKHHFVDTWELTRSREVLLRDRDRAHSLPPTGLSTGGLLSIPFTPTGSDAGLVDEPEHLTDLDMGPEEDTVRMSLDDVEGTPVPQRTRRRMRSTVSKAESESESEVDMEPASTTLSSSASSVGATPLPHPVPAIPQFTAKHVRQLSKDGTGLKSGLPKAAPRERLREKSTNVMARERVVR
ncbi:kinesin-domain-containing protein [Peniophora sp. CONT]|nr:kinesin-domain-containing protein [Peniophora sp. CONT]